MLVSKAHPGQFNVPYVAGMNNTNLPTTCFSVSNSVTEAIADDETAATHLGLQEYLLIMWCPAATAYHGDGLTAHIPITDRLGGFVITQIGEDHADDQWICKDSFQTARNALSMKETYGSDQTGFSSGGFVWAAEATFNILAPAAAMVGSFFKGSIQFG